MNHPTAAIQPQLDLEAMWQNSLIRVSDQLNIPPVVLRVDEAIIYWYAGQFQRLYRKGES